jgi:hypothetical protein
VDFDIQKAGKKLLIRSCNMQRNVGIAERWWLTPVTQEAEIRRIRVQSQPRQIVRETLSRKYPSQK